MFSLVLHALRARRAQALAMFALAVLAGLGSAAAPWFLGWGSESVARNAAAPAAERLVYGAGSSGYDPSAPNPLDVLRNAIEEHLSVAGSEITVGASLYVTARPVPNQGTSAPPTDDEEPGNDGPGDQQSGDEEPGDEQSEDQQSGDEQSGEEEEPDEEEPARRGGRFADLYLVTRTNICDHLRIVEGSCPDSPQSVALTRNTADRLGVGVGDLVSLRGIRLSQGTVRVSGLYEVIDPLSTYWVGIDVLREADGTGWNPAVVSEETLRGLEPDSMALSAQMLLPPGAFVDPDADLRRTLREGVLELQRMGLGMTNQADALLNRIARDRNLVLIGVTVGAGQLVLLSWVGLFLAVRHTSEERRGDIGLLKLRGTKSRRVWTLIALGSGLPVLAGTVAGAIGGFVVASALTYRIDPGPGVLGLTRTAADPVDSLWLSLAAAAVAALGGLVVALVAEWRAVRAPVVDLLRRVPGGHRGWKADVADLVVVALAGAGVYQGWVESNDGGRPSPLALLAPALVGLALALLVARALPPVAARIGVSALRAGRAGAALAALHLARRQGTQRVFTVLAVAAAVFTTTTIVWNSATGAWQQRAVLELGADRVLTVEAPGAAALLEAVRAVDPAGRYAMAVATTAGARTENRVVAVDTSRYGAVGRLPAGRGSPAELAQLLRPTSITAPQVVDGPLSADVTVGDVGFAVELLARLSTVDGRDVAVEFPALDPGQTTTQAEVTGCAPSCRLVAIEVVAPGSVTVEIHDMSQPGGSVLDAAALSDIARWRTTLMERRTPPTVSSGDTGLTVRVAAGRGADGSIPDGRVLPLTVPVPLPVALAGAPPTPRGGEVIGVSVLGRAKAPFVVATRMPVLPVVGERGMLVDLEYAVHSNDTATESASLSVWLTGDAPDDLIAALADHGVTVVGDQSVAQRARELSGQGPGLALQFGYFAVAVILLLAAGVAVVGTTVDRGNRVAELVALRAQGLPTRAVRTAGIAGTAAMVAAAVLTGVVAALVAEALVAAALPVFADGWTVLPPPPGLTPVSLLVAVAVTVVVLGVASLAGARSLVAAATLTGGPGRRGRTSADGRHRADPAGVDRTQQREGAP